VQLDESEIFKAATDYQNWKSWKGYVYTNLPRFDDSVMYGLTTSEEDTMIQKEIHKYAQFARSDEPDLFNSNEILGATDTQDLKDLSNIIDQILCNLQIVQYDNALLALKHSYVWTFYDSFKKSRKVLQERYQEEPHWIIGRKPKLLSNESNNTEVYHALIDFVFKSLAWWLMHLAQSKQWNVHIIAVLARWAVKLKTVGLDPTLCAQKALAEGSDLLRQIAAEQKDEEETLCLPADEPSAKEKREIRLPDDPNLAVYYYRSKSYIREPLFELVTDLFASLDIRQSWLRTSAGFAVRTLIYRGGLDQTLRQLSVQGTGGIETSSDATNIKYSCSALQLLLSNSGRIEKASKAEKSLNSLRDAEISWRHINKIGNRYDLKDIGLMSTKKLDDIISVLVPLNLMRSSSLVNGLKVALVAWTAADEEDNPQTLGPIADETFEIEFSLRTRGFPSKSSQPVITDPYERDIIPASQSPIFTGLNGKQDGCLPLYVISSRLTSIFRWNRNDHVSQNV
jgi:hypothetical protein